MKKNKPLSRVLLWLIQFMVTALVSLVVSLTLFLGTVPHAIFLYGVLPLACAFTAAKCVFRGLNNYLALIAPPIVFPLVYLIVWGYPPAFAPFAVCSVITVFGSAYGETARRLSAKKHRQGE